MNEESEKSIDINTESAAENISGDIPAPENTVPASENEAMVPENDVPAVEIEAPAPENSALTHEQGELTPEHIGALLKALGDDIILDMLESAGLADEDETDAAEADEESGSSSEEPGSADGTVKKKRRRRKGRNSRRFLFVLIFIGILGLLVAMNKIYMSVSINSHDPINYSVTTDSISAEEGLLKVNDVRVTVPTDGTEEYSISYSWSATDEKYPSVPHAITAIYPKASEENSEGISESTESKADNAESTAAEGSENDADKSGQDSAGTDDNNDHDSAASDDSSKPKEKLYSITLYRNETIAKADIPSGKTAATWFDDSETVNDDDVIQEPLKTGDISGFYIHPRPAGADEQPSDYTDYSYYFAVPAGEGVSIYVLEGDCMDEDSAAAFQSIMDECIKSITIEAKESKTETEEENEEESSDA